MSKLKPGKVAIIGCGFVGSASAFALMQSGLFTEMVLLDANHQKAEGEAEDIVHGIPFGRPMQIYAGDYDDIADAAIIVQQVQIRSRTKPDWIWCTKTLQFSSRLFRKLQKGILKEFF